MKRAIIIAAMLAAAGLAGAQMFAQLFGATGTPSRLPAGYRECDYLKSSGTQYINTGHINTGYTAFSIVYSRVAAVGYGHVVFSDSRFCWRGNSSDSTLAINYNSGSQVAIGSHPGNGVLITGSLNYDTATVNGKEYAVTARSNTPLTTSEVCIFGVPSETAYVKNSKSRIHSFKIFEGAETKRDMIPALDGSGVPCMFDLVTQAAFYNAGTGTFAYKLKE